MRAIRHTLSLMPLTLLISACSAGDAVKAAKKADAALAHGDYDTAIAHFDEAIRLDPMFARAHHGRGVSYFHKAQYDMSVASYDLALRLEPKNDVTLFDRGLAQWEKGEPQRAMEDFQQAILVNPTNDSAHNGLAWALSTTPQDELRDGKKAVELVTKACELTEWKNPFHLSTLAAAYAELGDFQRAIKWHMEAMASPDFPPEKMDRARERLELYERGKPYREIKQDIAAAAYDDPKATYRTYIEALRKNDINAAKRCWVIDDDNKSGALDTIVGLWISMRQINHVAEKKFGAEGLAALKGWRRDDVADVALDRTKERLDDAQVKITGDTAELTMGWKEDDGVPNPAFGFGESTPFRNVGGNWKIDANKMTGLKRGIDMFEKGTWGPLFRDQVFIMHEAIDGIEKGKLKSAKELGDFIENKIEVIKKKYGEEGG